MRRAVGRRRHGLRRAGPRAAHAHARLRPRPGAAARPPRSRRARGPPGLVPADGARLVHAAAPAYTSSNERSTDHGRKVLCLAHRTRRTTPTRRPSPSSSPTPPSAPDKETMVFLSTEGVRLARQGYADDIHEEGFAPLKDLMANFADGRRQDLRLLAVLQEAQARREQARRRRDDRRRREAGRVPRRRRALRLVLRPTDATMARRRPASARRRDVELRRRRPRLRQRPAAADPPAHRSAARRGSCSRSARPRSSVERGPAGLVPDDGQRAGLARARRAASASFLVSQGAVRCRAAAPTAAARPRASEARADHAADHGGHDPGDAARAGAGAGDSRRCR